MLGEGLEHVIKEGNRGLDAVFSLPVHIERKRDLGLLGIAYHLGFAGFWGHGVGRLGDFSRLVKLMERCC